MQGQRRRVISAIYYIDGFVWRAKGRSYVDDMYARKGGLESRGPGIFAGWLAAADDTGLTQCGLPWVAFLRKQQTAVKVDPIPFDCSKRRSLTDTGARSKSGRDPDTSVSCHESRRVAFDIAKNGIEGAGCQSPAAHPQLRPARLCTPMFLHLCPMTTQ